MNTLPVIDLVATGQNIAHIRERAGYSVRDLQIILGFTTPQAIYKWQRGESIPSIDNLAALSAILKVTLDEIIIYKSLEEKMRTTVTYFDKENNRTNKEDAWTVMTQVFNDAGNLQRTGYSAGEAQIRAARTAADTTALDIRDETDGKNWHFTKNIVRAGRDSACDIVFDQKEDKKKIDKIHAVFELRQNIWHVVDMSKTGIRLNGEKIPSGIPKALKVGDEVELGQRRKLRIN